jgi:hypothetical protein
MRAPLPPIKTCPHGCRYANDGWHAENCPGGPKGVGPQAVFLQEPEYQRERDADERDRRHEAYEDQRLHYGEKGMADV